MIRWFISARISRFRNPVILVRKPGLSMITPKLFGKSASFPISCPCTRITPEVTGKNPQIHFIRTVFPEPLFPTIPQTSPFLRIRSASFSTQSSPKYFVTFTTWITCSDFTNSVIQKPSMKYHCNPKKNKKKQP